MRKISVTRRHVTFVALNAVLWGQVDILKRIVSEASVPVHEGLPPPILKKLIGLSQKHGKEAALSLKNLEKSNYKRIHRHVLAILPGQPQKWPQSIDEALKEDYTQKDIINYMLLEIQAVSLFPAMFLLNSYFGQEIHDDFQRQLFSFYKTKKWSAENRENYYQLLARRHREYYQLLTSINESRQLIVELGNITGANILGEEIVNNNFSRTALSLGQNIPDVLKHYGAVFEEYVLQD